MAEKVEVKLKETLDVEAIRQDFPILEREVHGKQLVYLDNAATSQKPNAVIEALADYYRRYNANVHRGVYQIAEEATQAYENARRKVAGFIHAATPREIVFVRNATEAVNLVAYGWGRKNIKAGDEILLTEMEHHSNLVPWQELAKEKGAKLKFIPFDGQGRLVLDSLDGLLTERTKLVGVTLMSNVLGTINAVRTIADVAHARGALVMVDGAQGVCHLPVDVRELGCDFLAISGHKMLGPTGIGVLFARRELLDNMDPFNSGGSMIKEVWLEGARWNELPWKFEAGTPSIAEGIGLGIAVDYLNQVGMEKVRAHEEQLVAYALERLQEISGLEVYGPPAEERGGLVAFNLRGVHSHDLATLLDYEGIAVRAGHHCAMPLHSKLGIPATARASFYLYNTQEEADRLAEGLEKARHFFLARGGK